MNTGINNPGGEGMTLKKTLLSTGFLAWLVGGLGVVVAFSDPDERDKYDDTRTKRVAWVVFNPVFWLLGLIVIFEEDFSDDLKRVFRDFWYQPPQS